MENRTKKRGRQKPVLTVVIGTLNRPQVIIKLIEQLLIVSKSIFIEVLVFDQSNNKNYLCLKKQFPNSENFKLFHLFEPNTIQYLNLGWQKAQSELVLYLDDDVTIKDLTIPSHISAYDDLSIKAVAGRVINDGEMVTVDPKVGRILWFGAEFKKNFTFEKKTFVDFPYGCNMSFRKQTLRDLDGFDAKLSPPIYSFNEVDLGYRISHKWKNSVLFVPKALVYHRQYKLGGTRDNFDTKRVSKSNNLNYGYFLGKNFSLFENIICFLKRFLYQVIKEPKAIPEIIKGYFYAKK